MASTTREVHSISAIEEREFPETGEVTRKVAAVLGARGGRLSREAGAH